MQIKRPSPPALGEVSWGRAGRRRAAPPRPPPPRSYLGCGSVAPAMAARDKPRAGGRRQSPRSARARRAGETLAGGGRGRGGARAEAARAAPS